MKKLFTLFFSFLFITSSVYSAKGWFNDFIYFDKDATGPSLFWIGNPYSSGTQLDGYNFGDVTSLSMGDIDLKYWANDGNTHTGSALWYKVVDVLNEQNVIVPTEIVLEHQHLGGNDYQGTKTQNIDLLTGLESGKTYRIEMWAKNWDGTGGDSWLSNNSNNYKATFTVAGTAAVHTWHNCYFVIDNVNYSMGENNEDVVDAISLNGNDVDLGVVKSIDVSAYHFEYQALREQTGGSFYYRISEDNTDLEIKEFQQKSWNQLDLGGLRYIGASTEANLDLLSGLTLTENKKYRLTFYADAVDDVATDSLNNSGNNFIIRFTYAELPVGINEVESTTIVSVDNGEIKASFEGAANVELFSLTGKLIKSANVNGLFAQKVIPGVYILSIDGKAHKVVVH